MKVASLTTSTQISLQKIKTAKVTPLLLLPTALLLGLYIFLKPVYVFDSGLPQPSDFVMVILIAVIFWMGKFEIKDSRWLVHSIGLFASYTLIVGFTWGLILGDIAVASTGLFYLYNFLASLITIHILKSYGDAGLKIITIFILFSMTVQIGMAPLSFSIENSRQTLFFNNPNQLGYWALLSGTICLIGARAFENKFLIAILASGLMVPLVAMSLSKAALATAALTLAIYWRKSRLLPIFMIILIPLIIQNYEQIELASKVADRLSTFGAQSDDNFAARGYDRIWLHPGYLVFGAGESGFERFNSAIPGEMHSTLGAVIFSYGIIGFILFTAIFIRIFYENRFWDFAYLIPVFLYGVTHQGLRFTFFWMLICIVALLSNLGHYTEINVKKDTEPSKLKTGKA